MLATARKTDGGKRETEREREYAPTLRNCDGNRISRTAIFNCFQKRET